MVSLRSELSCDPHPCPAWLYAVLFEADMCFFKELPCFTRYVLGSHCKAFLPHPFEAERMSGCFVGKFSLLQKCEKIESSSVVNGRGGYVTLAFP